MLSLRRKQVEAFILAELKVFEARMLEHTRKFFPNQLQMLGEENTREWIQYGIRRASTYEIVAQRDVCKYIDVMLILGRDFDHDPKFAWASRTLGDRKLDAGGRVDRLVEMAARTLANELHQ